MQRIVSSSAAALLSVAALAAPSHAADQPPLLSPTPVAFNWSGFYFGVFGGAGWTDVDYTDLFTDAFGGNFYTPGGNSYTLEPEGKFFGAQVGVDWQFSKFVVVGAAAEGGFMDIDDALTNPWALPVPAESITLPYSTFDTGWYAAVTGRVGVPFNRFLIYARGGVAFLSARATTIDTCARFFCGQTAINASGDDVLLGWTAGAGVEAALAEHLRAGVEYRFYDFESFEVSGIANNGLEYHSDVEMNGLHTARAFVNFVW